MPQPNKPKRRIMRAFKLNEISAVDNPAQAGASITIMKRADQVGEVKDLIKKGRAILTTPANDHTHLVMLEDYDGIPTNSGTTSYQDEHTHPFIINDEGNLIIGEVDGHTHEQAAVSKTGAAYWSEEELTDLAKQHVRQAADNIGDNPREHDMPNGDKTAAENAKKAADEDLQKKNAELEKRAVKAEKVAELTDSQKAHYSKLNDTEKDEFLAKSAEQRAEIVKDAAKAAQDENPVVYTDSDGGKYRKNDDPRMIALAKRSDERLEKLEKSSQEAADLTLRKRAEDELKHLPGTVETHMTLLKQVDAISDEKEREEALKALRAQNAKMAGNFTTVGNQIGKADTSDSASANSELEKRAKDLQKADPKLTYVDAYDAASKADPELYAKAVSG